MLFMLGIDSQIVLVETVITSVIDIRPQLRRCKFLVLVTVCFAMCLVGLVMTTSGGLDVLNLFDTYAANWNLLMIVMFECITVSWIYGSKRFMQDINVMLGEKFCRCCTFGSYCKLFWSICWSYVTPAMCLVMMVLSWVRDRRTHYFPIWAQFIGCLFTLSGLTAIVGRAVWNIKHAPGSGFGEKLRYTLTPTKYWGPALLEHRILITSYVPGFVVYPDIDSVDLELLKKSIAAAAAKENPNKGESGMKTESETELSTA